MSKKWTNILIIGITLIILVGLYYVEYPTKKDRLSLKCELMKFEKLKDIEIQKIENIDNKILVLYTYDNGIGCGEFIKGTNGRCLLVSSNVNSGVTFIQKNLKTNKGNYNVLMGKNFDSKINYVKLMYDYGQEITADVSKSRYFVASIGSGEQAITFIKYDLLDKNGISIREEIINKYFKNSNSSHAKAKTELGLFKFWYGFVVFISVAIIILISENDKSKFSIVK